MRILYLHQYFSTPRESWATRSYEIARRMVAAGHHVDMLTTDRRRAAGDWEVTEEDGIVVHRVGVPYDNSMSNFRRMISFVRFLLLASGRAMHISADLVYATSTPLTIAVPGVLAARRQRIPMVFEVRDLWPGVPIALGQLTNPLAICMARLLERVAYSQASRIVALSPGMAARIASMGVRSQKVAVVPNGCDPMFRESASTSPRSFLAHHGIDESRRVLLYAGTFGLVNGVGYLVDLAKRMRQIDQGIAFVMIGDGRERQQVEERARREGLLGVNVWILPPVAKSELVSALHACTAACSVVIDNPALWDNCANKFFDALAAGRPVVINHQGWLAEVIRDQQIGVVLPANDLDAATRELRAFMRDDERLAAAREGAYQLARQSYSRDAQAGEVMAMCAAAISDYNSKRKGSVLDL